LAIKLQMNHSQHPNTSPIHKINSNQTISTTCTIANIQCAFSGLRACNSETRLECQMITDTRGESQTMSVVSWHSKEYALKV
jgi:hypothetical protein